MQHLASMHDFTHLIPQCEVWRLLANLHGGSDAKARKAWALSAERGTGWPVQLPKRQRAHVHTDETFTTGVGSNEFAPDDQPGTLSVPWDSNKDMDRGFPPDRLYRGP